MLIIYMRITYECYHVTSVYCVPLNKKIYNVHVSKYWLSRF